MAMVLPMVTAHRTPMVQRTTEAGSETVAGEAAIVSLLQHAQLTHRLEDSDSVLEVAGVLEHERLQVSISFHNTKHIWETLARTSHSHFSQ